MGYYRGDYYRGDYYRGDLWSSIAKVGKAFTDPVGYVTGQLFGSGKRASSGGGPPAPPAATMPGGAGGSSWWDTAKQYVQGKGAPPPGAMRGYHWNKSNEYDPSSHGKVVVPKHTKMVRNRHMNVANPRALARAARRAHGFLRLTKKFTRYYQGKTPKGRAYIGRRKKR